MFRVTQHPSSEVLETVTAASGTGHNIGQLLPSNVTRSPPEDGRNYRPKHVELNEIINKLLLLHLVGGLLYCINDARSHKHEMHMPLHYICSRMANYRRNT